MASETAARHTCLCPIRRVDMDGLPPPACLGARPQAILHSIGIPYLPYRLSMQAAHKEPAGAVARHLQWAHNVQDKLLDVLQEGLGLLQCCEMSALSTMCSASRG